MNRAYLAGILLATLAWSSVAQEKAPGRPDFNGIYPEMTRADFDALYPVFAKGCRKMPTGRVYCMYFGTSSEMAKEIGIPASWIGAEPNLNTFAGEPVESAFVTLDPSSEKIFTLSFELYTRSFDIVGRALTKRFGKPHTRTSRIRDRTGAEFDQVQMRWTIGSTIVECEKRSGSMDMMKVSMVSRAAMAIIEKEIKAMEAKGAKDR
ncbi:hypothetical protein DSM104443_01174 [Usitatibacter rugosus]|uniref:Uncharacterized protein n=1 Tax=Usitatibacter rugosus TaxID=2732067 RepID=A0A6M4GS11_9PROT|nr:hypothetical protein [Usitatibacter rugosus]QJR10120.1 hypothetical protein DSM104443_01174 [Usitatibacter rugosus]